MNQLRQKMLEELQRRNYSHRTATAYMRVVREFAEHFHQSPDKLGPEHIRQFQAHLFQTKKLSPFTVSQYVSALRFLFVKALRRTSAPILVVSLLTPPNPLSWIHNPQLIAPLPLSTLCCSLFTPAIHLSPRRTSFETTKQTP